MNVNNRWVQLGAALVAMVMIANLQYSWTLFVNPIQAATGWKLSEISLAFTLFILFQTWVQPLDGWLIDLFGPRLFITVAGVLCGVGWAAMGSAHTLPMFYASYIMAGVGAALVYSGSMGSALKWFRDRRGLAAGIIAAGFGGGTALFIPVNGLPPCCGPGATRRRFSGPASSRARLRVFVAQPPVTRPHKRAAGRRSEIKVPQPRAGRRSISRRSRCCARRTSTRCTPCS